MLIVDAQVHIWAADRPDRPWPKDVPGVAHEGPLSAEQLKAAMVQAGVDRAVLVPPAWEGTRNDLALAAAQAEPDRFAVMGRLDPAHPEARDRIAGWRSQPGMLGLRMNVWFDPNRAWLEDGTLDWLFSDCERLGIPMMVLATGALPSLEGMVKRHPQLKVIIDHMGIRLDRRGVEAFAEQPHLLALARLPNVAVKLTALPCVATDAYPYRSVHDRIHAVFDAFGPHRLFWGTDLTQLPCSYREAVAMFTETMPWLRGPDLEDVMGRALCRWLDWP